MDSRFLLLILMGIVVVLVLRIPLLKGPSTSKSKDAGVSAGVVDTGEDQSTQCEKLLRASEKEALSWKELAENCISSKVEIDNNK